MDYKSFSARIVVFLVVFSAAFRGSLLPALAADQSSRTNQTDPAAADPARVELIDGRTPWSVYLVTASPREGTAEESKPRRKGKDGEPSPFPPPDWMEPDFDDSHWGRYHDELGELLGGYGHWQSLDSALLCLRTRFGISDPAAVNDLKLTVAYRGGVVVYVNGRQVARNHMPAGPIEPLTLAEDYPPAAYYRPDADARLPRSGRPAKELTDRYEMRIRRLTAEIPRDLLRRGSNVLAIEIHRTALRRLDWSSLGFYKAELTSPSRHGVIPYAEAIHKLHLWNPGPLATIVQRTEGKTILRTSWDRGSLSLSAAGFKQGNPFEPLRPVKMIAARNSVCSGQIVVSDPAGLKNVSATLGPLVNKERTRIPDTAIRIQYAVQQQDARYCDALTDRPATDVPVQPVWIVVDVPEDQPPGWYTGALTVTANHTQLTADVQLLVSAWTMPDPRNFRSHASLLQSPDTLALQYDCEPFSDAHFELIEKSLELMGTIGNDVVYIPVIHGTHMGHRTGMIRWVRTQDGYDVDFAPMQKYLDLYTKHCGPPKVLCIVLWKPTLGNNASFRGVRVTDPLPLVVTGLDPETGKTFDLHAPMYGRPGSEALFKPMWDGLRQIVRKRRWDQGILMIGQGFDSRPLKPVQQFFGKIAPDARWVVFSHWLGEPHAAEGKLIVSGGMEVGYRQIVSTEPLPELHPDYPDVPARDYISAGAHRIEVLPWSSPTSYRNIPNITGTFCRIGLDFWPVVSVDGHHKDIFNTKICGPWLYKAHPVAITAPGPRGALSTVRFQMLREGVQETEARIFIAKTIAAMSDARKQPYRELLEERVIARRVGAALTQAQLSLDWLGLTARMYRTAGNLAGEPDTPLWNNPPPAPDR